MDKKNINKSIPIDFEQIQEVDSRFKRFKIWIVNVGKNYNGSIFTKEAIERAIPTIYNTPVLGYINENRLGEKDFSGHEEEIVIVDGEFKTRYLGSAYGVIPQDCNPKFELRENEFGGIEEYLTVEAIMWTKFTDAVDLMDKYKIKNQSMELHDEYSGQFNEEGYFVFEDFKFYGSCILGEGVEPAIPRSTIEHLFSKHNIQKKIEEKMSEYHHIFEKHLQSKEVNNEMEKEKVENVEEIETDMEQKEEVEVVDEVVEDEVESKEDFAKDEDKEEKDDEDDKEDDKEDEKEDDKEDEDEDEDNEKFSKLQSKLSEYESSVLELKSEIDKLNQKIYTLQKENDELNQFKRDINKAQHEAKAEELFAQFSKLDIDDYEDIKSNVHNFSIEEIESKLYERLGRKTAVFSKSNNDKNNHVKIVPTEDAKTGGYSHLFTKHGYKN